MARGKDFEDMDSTELHDVLRRLEEDIDSMGTQIARSQRTKRAMEREKEQVLDLIAVKSQVKGWKK